MDYFPGRRPAAIPTSVADDESSTPSSAPFSYSEHDSEFFFFAVQEHAKG
jgi:hypothetical protein